MELWKAHYQDKQHDLDCVIENLYTNYNAEQPLKMCIDGVTFWGSDFDDWVLSKTEDPESINSIINHFSLIKYGCKEKGYYYWLQSYQLQVKIPVLVFSLDVQCKISAELIIIFNNQPGKNFGTIYELDNERIKPNTTICQKFALIVGKQYFEAETPSTFFEISLQSICKQISGKFYLCNCFGCLYSDYSPYGQGNIGNLFCFIKNKESYLKVYSKYEGEYTIWNAFNNNPIECQETGLCKNFSPRINCLGGYRGTIYE